MNGRRTKTLLAVVVVVIAGLILAGATLFTVDERETAVILQFGKPVRSIEVPGLYAKVPFVQEVRRFPRTLQFWQTREEIVDLPTADGKKVEVQAWALWRITDPLRFVQVLRTVQNGELAVQDRVRAAIRDEITRHDLAEVVRSSNRELTYSFRFELPSTVKPDSRQQPDATQLAQPGAIVTIEVGREKIMERIRENVQKRLAGDEEGEVDRGVELVDVGISNIGFVPAVREAAFERLKAFMDSIAAGYYNSGVQRKQEILNRTKADVEQILGEAEQKANVIRGKADAEIIDKYAAAINETGDLYNFLKTLEVYGESLQGKTRLIITTDSDLFRLLKEVGPAAPSVPPTTVPAAKTTSDADR